MVNELCSLHHSCHLNRTLPAQTMLTCAIISTMEKLDVRIYGHALCRLNIDGWHYSVFISRLKAPSTLRRRNLKTEVSLWKRIKCFPSTLRRRNVKTEQSPVSLDLCLKKTRSGKSHDYRDVVVLEKLRFQNVSRSHAHDNEKPALSNSFAWKSVFEKLRFGYGLVWTVGLNVE